MLQIIPGLHTYLRLAIMCAKVVFEVAKHYYLISLFYFQ